MAGLSHFGQVSGKGSAGARQCLHRSGCSCGCDWRDSSGGTSWCSSGWNSGVPGGGNCGNGGCGGGGGVGNDSDSEAACELAGGGSGAGERRERVKVRAARGEEPAQRPLHRGVQRVLQHRAARAPRGRQNARVPTVSDDHQPSRSRGCFPRSRRLWHIQPIERTLGGGPS